MIIVVASPGFFNEKILLVVSCKGGGGWRLERGDGMASPPWRQTDWSLLVTKAATTWEGMHIRRVPLGGSTRNQSLSYRSVNETATLDGTCHGFLP